MFSKTITRAASGTVCPMARMLSRLLEPQCEQQLVVPASPVQIKQPPHRLTLFPSPSLISTQLSFKIV